MESRIMQVFYGNDCLPYKDKERTVHFPIVGNAIQNANNTTQIKFYFDRLIEENEQTTFVAVSKLPNGKIGSKILETYDDEELGEQYALLDLDSFYTQYKGDVFISLQGYQGGVRVEEDEQGIYQIYGTPVIAATGSIKLAINYAPSFVGSGETENVTLQQVLGELSTKLGVRQETLHVEELPTVGNPDIWYVVNDDEDDPTKANIYIWNATTQTYIWVGDNTLDLGDYYTTEQGQEFEEEIDQRIANVENTFNGSPKGVYATLSDLETAYPTGTTGIYVVSANGHWYYWNGSVWADGGVYQSSEGVVPETRTIANISLANDISKESLQKALDIDDIGNELSSIEKCIVQNNGLNISILGSEYEYGRINSSTGENEGTNNKYVRTKGFFKSLGDANLVMTDFSNYTYHLYRYSSPNSNSYLDYVNITDVNVHTYLEKDKYYRMSIYATSDIPEENIPSVVSTLSIAYVDKKTQNDNINNLLVKDGQYNINLTSSNMFLGTIDATTGKDGGTGANRMKTDFIYIPYDAYISLDSSLTAYVYRYNSYSDYVNRQSLSNNNKVDGGTFVRLQLAKTNGNNFADNEKATIAGYIKITGYSYSKGKPLPSSYKLTLDKVTNFVLSANYDNDDYSYTNVTNYIDLRGTRGDQGIPLLIPLIEKVVEKEKTITRKQVKIGMINYLTDGKYYDVPSNQKFASIKNLIPNKTYYCRYFYAYSDGSSGGTDTFSFKGENYFPRMLNIDGIQNVRDIGGWSGENSKKVKYGLIIRGSCLDENEELDLHITDVGKVELLKYIGIKTDIDLRSGHTYSILGDYVDYISNPISNYVSLVNNAPQGTSISTLVTSILTALAANKPIYIHCQGGCDRTGSFIALLLALLGVSESDIAKEYELSSFSKIGEYRYRNSTVYNYSGMISAIKSLTGSTFQEKVENWFLSCGVTQEQIVSLKSYLLE